MSHQSTISIALYFIIYNETIKKQLIPFLVIHVNCLTVDRRSEGYADCVPQAADYPVMDCELKMAVAVSFVLKTLNYKLKADIPADQGSMDHLVAVRPGLMEG